MRGTGREHKGRLPVTDRSRRALRVQVGLLSRAFFSALLGAGPGEPLVDRVGLVNYSRLTVGSCSSGSSTSLSVTSRVHYHDLEPTGQPPGTGPTACPTGPGGPPDLRQSGQVGTPDFTTALRFVT